MTKRSLIKDRITDGIGFNRLGIDYLPHVSGEDRMVAGFSYYPKHKLEIFYYINLKTQWKASHP